MGDKKNKRDLATQMVDGIAKRPEDAKTPAEKERIEEDQAECEQIEAEMEAEVEAKYEDFLDAQKYDPSLRA